MSRQAYIKAVSVYLPETIEKNDAEDRFIKKLGIAERRIAGEDEFSSDLAMKAAESLFTEYDLDRNDIDFIILCTQQPEYFMPTTACILHDKLKLKRECGALDYNLGCSAYAYGLALVKGLIESNMANNVLLITASLYTKYINKTDKSIRHLFGDGATATLLSNTESETPYLHSFVFGTDGSKYDSLIIPVGGDRYPTKQNPEVEVVDGSGSKRTNYEVFMDGQEILHFTLREVPKLVDDILEKSGLMRQDIDYFVFHQANKFMLNYIQKKANLQGLPFFNDCVKEGNIVSGTIPLGLAHIVADNDVQSLRNVMLAGFGVGLSWSGCIADLSLLGK